MLSDESTAILNELHAAGFIRWRYAGLDLLIMLGDPLPPYETWRRLSPAAQVVLDCIARSVAHRRVCCELPKQPERN